MHVVVEMAPPSMQLYSLILPSSYTLFWTLLLVCIYDPMFLLFNFKDYPKKQKAQLF